MRSGMQMQAQWPVQRDLELPIVASLVVATSAETDHADDRSQGKMTLTAQTTPSLVVVRPEQQIQWAEMYAYAEAEAVECARERSP